MFAFADEKGCLLYTSSQVVGLKDNPSNYLLMQAMGPNVAGVIGTAVAAGTMLAQFGG